jgi:hypothetical protein
MTIVFIESVHLSIFHELQRHRLISQSLMNTKGWDQVCRQGKQVLLRM